MRNLSLFRFSFVQNIDIYIEVRYYCVKRNIRDMTRLINRGFSRRGKNPSNMMLPTESHMFRNSSKEDNLKLAE